MRIHGPGLDRHEWEARWAELEESLAEDPADALALACDEIEQLLRAHEGDELPQARLPELEPAYAAARAVADRYEQGLEVGPGDVGAAVENLRAIRAALS